MSWKALWPVIVFAASQHVFAQTPSPTLVRKSERAEMFRSAENPFMPVWSGYALIGVRGNRTAKPIIWAWPTNAGIEDIEFTIPGAEQLLIWAVAASADHTIAIAGTAVGGNSQGSGFIGIIPPDRGKKLIVRTTPYIPMAITAAPDGVIWTVGWDMEDGNRAVNILKRFGPSGVLLSSRNMAVEPAPGRPDSDVSEGSRLRSSADRVGWLTGAGQYLEFSFDGSEISRFGVPAYQPGKQNGFVLRTFFYLALGENKEVLVEIMGASRPNGSFWRLNRDARGWTPVNVGGEQLSPSAWLLGFDGNELMIDTETPNRGELLARFSFSPGS